ncbi:bifunctional 4-hydroxy-2-oxoglutarate aldolase/2-dehydro-3-deoxy-phosphogluconate aldolase [Eilatimonas milleporae]|uniref:2-dehydro-3-deoxy-phosphogluconate aldolase n=1 Tax=Eilatimonas milleporae TaxID=911205 RepID=A0A3M0CEF5_9PROT|nr:bifunctional 4-hydroxy-2-oxoglutarate aldolase/2-dehydro-3-deoxy-phosphogluconate aldolase [Eilatimonas milleporae]RMB07732.1 2-keto-3-deoxy-phosphogluconate aldolase [Eilatimonas milleporae]
MKIDDILKVSPVIPVLSFRAVDEAVSVCRCLYEEGLKVLEITLRHPAAVDCIRAVRADLPDDTIVGAGTILDSDRAWEAHNAGATFGVSPGLTKTLGDTVKAMDWPFLPGIATLSEAMMAKEHGFTALKFFPAEISGGIGFLKAVGSVLPELTFCPTGGVTGATAASYLALKNVAAVGGSWLTERNKAGEIDPAIVRTKAAAAVAHF